MYKLRSLFSLLFTFVFLSFSNAQCDISELVAEVHECDDQGNYLVDFSFAYENPGPSNMFIALIGGSEYGPFEYGEPFYTIGPFEGDCSGALILRVEDLDDEACAAVNDDLPNVCCEAGECSISNVTATQQDCNESDEFEVVINFDYENVGTEGFRVVGNGIDHGDFEYASLPITIGPLPGDCEIPWEFVVIDNQTNTCQDFAILGEVCCSVECVLSELTVEIGECNPDDTYNIVVDFVHQGTDGVGFDLFANGEFFGFYSYDDLPLSIPDFPSSGGNLDEVTVCENDDPSCCATQVYESPCQCSISEMSFQIGECNDNGQFNVTVDFEYVNTSDEGFTISANGQNFGNYSYDDLPVTIGPLDGNGDVYEVLAVDLVDPLCFGFNEFESPSCSQSNCEIGELNVELGECNDDGFFFVTINFEYANVGNEGFSVMGNGNDYGDFEYENLPITIDGLDGNCETLYEFVVRDNQFEDCASDFGFQEPICCDVQGECSISNITVETGECTGDGLFQITLDFDYENVTNDFFDVWSGDIYVGFYAYADLPVTIEEFPERVNSDFDIITICDNDNESCCASLEFDGPECSTSNNCEIGELVVDLGECNDDGFFFVTITFEYANVGEEGFSLMGNGVDYGDFEYENLPITIDGLDGNCETLYEFVVTDNQFEDCASDFGFQEPICCDNQGECEIGELNVEIGECNDEGFFFVTINFEYVNVGNEGFSVVGNGNDYGDFEYADLPITIDGLDGNCETLYEFVVIDNQFDGCASDFGFQEPICCDAQGECSISNITVETGECTGDGLFQITLNFDYENVTNDFFDVWSGDIYVGFYAYADLPVIIEEFPERVNSDFDIITVCDNDNETCCSTHEFDGPECSESNNCEIGELNVEISECNDNGNFFVVINFEYANVGNEGFSVLGNGNDYGDFEYADLPITIEGLDGNCETLYEFVVIDNQFEDCASDFGFQEPICCDTQGDCEIGELNVEISECNDNGNFFVVINFEYANVGNEGFSVLGNGNDYGDFEYADLPITIEGLDGNCETLYEFVVIDNQFEDCASDFGFQEPICCDNQSDCIIGELNVDLNECNEDGFFFVTINFEYANVGDEGFSVLGNGNDYGDYAYDDLPIIIEGLVGNCETIYEFVVIDNQFEDCASDFAFEEPVCCDVQGNCEIGELNVELSECNDNGNFFVVINFEYANVGNEGFSVLGNGNDYGDFEYGNLPITIEGLDGNCETIYEFVVIDNQFEDCASDFSFEEPICCDGQGDCEIGELNVEASECNDNGNFFVVINFEYANVGEEGFSVVGNGNDYGDFEYDDLPITIEGLDGNCETLYEFVVIDNQFEDCASDFGFEEPICCDGQGDCEIGELSLDISECNDEGNFFVVIDFDFANVGDEGFEVVGNGNNYGTFEYDDLPITIDGLEGDCETFYEFVVRDLEFEDCASDGALEEPICCESTGLNDPDFKEIKLNVDQLSGMLKLENLPNHDNLEYQVYDMNAKLILSNSNVQKSESLSIEIPDLSAGMYLLRLRLDNQMKTFKFIRLKE